MEKIINKYFQSLHTDICDITVIADDDAITQILLNSFVNEDNKSSLTEMCCNELENYINGNLKTFTVPVKFSSTEFNEKVWKALLNIPYGETRTYGDIARITGNPKASRAVGNANHNNPLPIIIPCHRVVAKNGIGGYALPLEIKKKLLELEQNKEP